MRSLTSLMRHRPLGVPTYQLTDRLHAGRTACVPAGEIVRTVSTWLAELDAYSPLVEDLARTVQDGNWAAAYAIADQLAVDVTVAA